MSALGATSSIQAVLHLISAGEELHEGKAERVEAQGGRTEHRSTGLDRHLRLFAYCLRSRLILADDLDQTHYETIKELGMTVRQFEQHLEVERVLLS